MWQTSVDTPGASERRWREFAARTNEVRPPTNSFASVLAGTPEESPLN